MRMMDAQKGGFRNEAQIINTSLPNLVNQLLGQEIDHVPRDRKIMWMLLKYETEQLSTIT